MSLFLEYLKTRKNYFLLLVIFTLLNSLGSIPIPYLSKYLIDVVLIEKEYNNIWKYLIIVTFIVTVQLIAGRITVKVSANFFQKFLFETRKRIFASNFFTNDIDKTSLNTVIFNDSELYTTNIQLIITTILSNVFTGIAYIVVMLRLDWKLSVITFTFIPVYIIWIVYVSSKLSILSKQQQHAKDDLLAAVNNALLNFEVINIYNFTKRIVKSFDSIIDKNQKLNIKFSIYQNFINIVAGVIITIASIIPFIIGVTFVKNDNLTIGSLVAFNSYSGLLFVPITQLVAIISTIKISNVYQARIDYFINEGTILEEKRIPKIGRILLENLTVYSNDEIVLKNINLSISSGNWIRLSGANGSGKSLLLKSIAKLYKEYTGEIVLKTSKNKTINVAENVYVSSNDIIYVSNQQSFPLDNLFEEFTIKNEITTDEINDILNIVEIGEKISSLRNGIYTPNIEVLNEFSTGEVQKIRLARALVRKPSFLFLDEIFSNIELEQSIRILENIYQQYPEISLVVVEHHFPDTILFNQKFSILQKEIIVM